MDVAWPSSQENCKTNIFFFLETLGYKHCRMQCVLSRYENAMKTRPKAEAISLLGLEYKNIQIVRLPSYSLLVTDIAE